MGALAPDTPLLVDTATWIFWHAGSPRLSPTARTLLGQSLERPVHVSVVSAFEIATKVRLGKLAVPPELLSEFAYLVESDGFRVAPLDAAAQSRAPAEVQPHLNAPPVRQTVTNDRWTIPSEFQRLAPPRSPSPPEVQ